MLFRSEDDAIIKTEGKACLAIKEIGSKVSKYGDFPGGAVVKNPSANAGDTSSSPGPGRSHMPRMQLSPCATTTQPAL